MEEAKTTTVTALRHALENKQWSALKKHLGSMQTKLSSQATATEIARTLDTVREAADTFTETCSFTTAFETAYNGRRGLLRAGVCEWAVATLDGFRVFVPVIARLATVLGLLGTGVDERSHVGASGAVDLLTILWHNHPRCLEIVSALGSLCAGHIDNVSRTMRRRGLVVAMKILMDPECLDNHQLVERTLLYIGLCAICTPDNQQEGTAMVPALLDVLERLTDAGLPHVAEHVISAFGNISDCWTKEGYGYAIADHNRLVAAIVNSWSAFPRSRNMASAASRTLLAFFSSHVDVRDAILEHSETLFNIIDGCRQRTTTLQALFEIVNGRQQVAAPESQAGPTDLPSLNPTMADTSPDDDSDDIDPPTQRRQKRQRKARNHTNLLVRDTSTMASRPIQPTRSEKTPHCDGKIVPTIAKRRRRRTKKSGNAVALPKGGDTTPTSTKRGKGKAKLSERTPERLSRAPTRVAPKTGAEVIDLCSESDEETYSPVAPRDLALGVGSTPPKRRRALQK